MSWFRSAFVEWVLPAADASPDVRVGYRRFRLFAGIFTVYIGYAIPDLWARDLPQRALGIALIVAFLVLYLGALPVAAFGRPTRSGTPVVASMFAIHIAYLVFVGVEGFVLTTYLGVACVVALPRAPAIALVVALAAVSTFLPPRIAEWDTDEPQWAVGLGMLLVSFAMLSVTANIAGTIALHTAQREVKRLAAEQERLRIARDLHDLLGHALTSVIVKSDLATRLALREPERAKAEMAEVAALARQGLADVRSTVAGYREVTLVTEIATARSVLRSAGISADFPAAVESVPLELRETFGWVLREAITNVVRHSRAQHVSVRLEPRALEVVDDGIGPGASVTGTGLSGVVERVAAVGGHVVTGPAEPRGFRVRVDVPA